MKPNNRFGNLPFEIRKAAESLNRYIRIAKKEGRQPFDEDSELWVNAEHSEEVIKELEKIRDQLEVTSKALLACDWLISANLLDGSFLAQIKRLNLRQ